MFGMMSLHQIAAARGDGLRPEILKLLLARQIEANQPNVADLAAWRGEGLVQSGPNPSGDPNDASPVNVVQFTPAGVMPTAKARGAR